MQRDKHAQRTWSNPWRWRGASVAWIRMSVVCLNTKRLKKSIWCRMSAAESAITSSISSLTTLEMLVSTYNRHTHAHTHVQNGGQSHNNAAGTQHRCTTRSSWHARSSAVCATRIPPLHRLVGRVCHGACATAHAVERFPWPAHGRSCVSQGSPPRYPTQ